MKKEIIKIRIRPFPKQHLAYEALKTKDFIFFGGGAGGGKSWWLCESRLINCYLYPGYRSFIGRDELKNLMQSTYITWCEVCKFHKIPNDDWKLNGKYNYIEFKNGSRIDLLDIKYLPSDPLFERFGSKLYTDGAIEEAGEVHKLSFDVLKSRVGRYLNVETNIPRATICITGNPKKNWTYTDFYKPWKEGKLPSNRAFIQALYGDNLVIKEKYKEKLESIEDKATKERLMFGNWEYDDDPATLINYDSITDLFTNTVDTKGKYLTVDVARRGKDKIVFFIWNGWESKIRYYNKLGIDETANLVKEISKEEQIPYSHIIADDDGVGGGVVDILRGIKGFVNNSSPIENPITHEKENFANLKTQCYYNLADAVNNHKIAIRTEDEKIKSWLTEELEQVKQKDADKDGKLKIIGKDEIREKISRSPDFSDAMMMRMWFELKRVAVDSELNIDYNVYGQQDFG